MVLTPPFLHVRRSLRRLGRSAQGWLIEEWRQAWRLWSVRLNGLGLLMLSAVQIIEQAWSSLPPDLRHILPYAQALSVALFIAGLAARIVVQPALTSTREGCDGDLGKS